MYVALHVYLTWNFDNIQRFRPVVGYFYHLPSHFVILRNQIVVNNSVET